MYSYSVEPGTASFFVYIAWNLSDMPVTFLINQRCITPDTSHNPTTTTNSEHEVGRIFAEAAPLILRQRFQINCQNINNTRSCI